MKLPVFAATLSAAALGFAASPLPAQPLAYDTAAWELTPKLPVDRAPWTRVELDRELRERTAQQKARHEIDVYYYRIGHTLAFPLPLTRRPTRSELPPGVANLTYPWLIWLTWELEERWRILHAAWRTLGDSDAGRLLQRELAALATWEKFTEMNDQPGLGAAHLAGCLALALARPDGWDPALLASARAAADHLLEGDITPWFAKQWGPDKPWTPQRLVNIPVITLARAAELARVTGSPRAATLDRRMVEILGVWARFRTGAEFHSEGTTYDGYLLDSVTGWLAGHPERARLLAASAGAFRSVTDQWIHLTLPGRTDLHAPIGDVEPEMPFWTAPLARAAGWYSLPEASWLLARVAPSRLPAATLVEELGGPPEIAAAPRAPVAGPREHPHAVSLRTGWAVSDAAAIVSAPRSPMGHLQADAGHVVLGWQGRFWLTDPGYQQYRTGEEREYTLGPQAHNAPVINGTIQKPRAARVEVAETDAAGRQHTRLELAACYPGLPAGASVRRDLWLAHQGTTALVIRDRFTALPADAEILHHWLGGHHLAWAFVDGWARLSDGRRAVWIGTATAPIAPAELTRHPGSRGPIALAHRTKLAGPNGVRWWVFWCDDTGGWIPPKLEADDSALQFTALGQTGPAWRFAP
jgi:hypothetical protein